MNSDPSQFQPHFTILEYLEYLELGQFRNVCDVFYHNTTSLVFVDCGLWCFHLSRCSMAQHFSNRHATGFARSEVIPLKISLRGCSARHTGADECITPCLQYCASRSRNQLRIKEILGSLVLFLEKQQREIHCSPVPNERKEQQQSNYSKLIPQLL